MTRRYTLCIVLPIAVFCLFSCGTRGRGAEKSDRNDAPTGRAESVAPRDYADFVMTLADASPEEVSRGMDSLIASAAEDSAALGRMAEIMERYLDDPNSPLRDEALYIAFLETMSRQSSLGEAERLRVADKLETAKKNRPGMVATDFSYIDRDGRRRTLLATAAGRPLLLLFYDPECGHCSEILEEVSQSDVINDRVEHRALAVLAVYTEGNRELWERTKTSMPRQWIVGCDADSIVDRELYSIPAMPVIYLLDRDKTVVLKDAFLPAIEACLDATNSDRTASSL